MVLTALMFFAYGEIYSLFPAICGDAYGRKFASANAGLLYVAKGVASLLVPLSSLISASAAGWRGVFIAASIMNFVAAIMAIFVLKPLRAARATVLTVKIAVVGAGAIGGYVGGWLAAAGEDVTFIARGANLAAIRSNGMRVIGEDGTEVVARRGCVREDQTMPARRTSSCSR